MDVRVRVSFDRTSTRNHSASTAIEILDTLAGADHAIQLLELGQLTEDVKATATRLADWAAREARRRTREEKEFD